VLAPPLRYTLSCFLPFRRTRKRVLLHPRFRVRLNLGLNCFRHLPETPLVPRLRAVRLRLGLLHIILLGIVEAFEQLLEVRSAGMTRVVYDDLVGGIAWVLGEL
jgi:hypothetical protein